MQMPNKFTQKQREAYSSVARITDELIELEKLQEKARDPHNLLGTIAANLCLDSHPPYCVLEQRPRTAVTTARELGIGNDPFIQRVGALAFN
jgi:hypothetical protein